MLEDGTAALDAWVRANADWAGPVTFLVAFLESLPVVSILVPSTALFLGIGVLLGGGVASPVPVILACMAGGILGDAIGFWIARVLGPYAIRRRIPKSCRRIYARAVLAFRRWGWWAVFVGRFLGPMRAVTPLAAGVVGMGQWRFQTANILSAMLWAPLMLMPGSAGGWLAQHFWGQPDPLAIGGVLVLGLLLWMAWRRFRPAAAARLRATLDAA